MQEELDSEYPELQIDLLGVNEIGYDSGTDEMVTYADLPWLQDDEDALVWERWDVTYRDVVILDGDGVIVETYNLTEHSLSVDANYEELKALLVAVAEGR